MQPEIVFLIIRTPSVTSSFLIDIVSEDFLSIEASSPFGLQHLESKGSIRSEKKQCKEDKGRRMNALHYHII